VTCTLTCMNSSTCARLARLLVLVLVLLSSALASFTEMSMPTSSTLTASIMRDVRRMLRSSTAPLRFGTDVVRHVARSTSRIFSRYQNASRFARSMSGEILLVLTTNCLVREGFRLGMASCGSST